MVLKTYKHPRWSMCCAWRGCVSCRARACARLHTCETQGTRRTGGRQLSHGRETQRQGFCECGCASRQQSRLWRGHEERNYAAPAAAASLARPHAAQKSLATAPVPDHMHHGKFRKASPMGVDGSVPCRSGRPGCEGNRQGAVGSLLPWRLSASAKRMGGEGVNGADAASFNTKVRGQRKRLPRPAWLRGASEPQ